MSNFKNLTNAYPILKILGNRYVIVLVFFAVWMLFLDNTSYLEHRILNKQLNELEDNKKYYQDEIRRDNENIKLLKNPDQIEKYAEAMKVEFCEFDVLRHKGNQKIYIIDVNKTPYGPPEPLNKIDQAIALQKLSDAFMAMIKSKE